MEVYFLVGDFPEEKAKDSLELLQRKWGELSAILDLSGVEAVIIAIEDKDTYSARFYSTEKLDRMVQVINCENVESIIVSGDSPMTIGLKNGDAWDISVENQD